MKSDHNYKAQLKNLITIAHAMPNSRMLALAKLNALVVLNMQFESIMTKRALDVHPYDLTETFIIHAINELKAWHTISFIESTDNHTSLEPKSDVLEEKHHDLFQDLWVNFSAPEYHEHIERYIHRLRINDLADGFLNGKRCIDFGCGHGNFAHALVQAGAGYVLGIDYGENSIRYAEKARQALGQNTIEFKVASVYNVPAEDASFDFAIQNGVFHHLDDEDRAIRETHRVLRTGGHMWYYTDGAGGIFHTLWDASMVILRKIPHRVIIDHLEYLNVSASKRYHLGDGLNATYRHTTWEEITSRLSALGFGNFRRLVGGFPTDFDHDVIAADKFGKEKFGSGDLRLLAQKV